MRYGQHRQRHIQATFATTLHVVVQLAAASGCRCSTVLQVPKCNAFAQVTEECKDLLRGLLTASPGKRLTVAQVQNHAWFRQDLPAGALEVNSRLKLMDNVR